jgi:hypothetical protein
MSQFDNNKMQIIEYQYYGNVKLYSSLIQLKHVEFSVAASYQKSNHSNRTWLYGANGLIGLSIPLLGGRAQKVPFKDVLIAEDGYWRRQHWRSIHDSYRKAPWFEEYAWQLEELYRLPEKFLMDWNLKTMQWAIKVLGFEFDILAVNEPSAFDPISEYPVPLSTEYPKYQQVFSERNGFQPNLSIIDLILCEGPNALNYLHALANYKNSLKSLK